MPELRASADTRGSTGGKGGEGMNEDYPDMSTAEQLRWWAENCDRCSIGCQARGVLEKAARELEAREAHEASFDSYTVDGVKTRIILEQVKE